MRSLPYLILAYLALGLQIGLGDFVAWNGAKPNLPLIAAIFVALFAQREVALLGCFSLGLMQDLLTAQPPGLFALSYGLVAMSVVYVQQVVSREHPLTHLALGLFGGFAVALILALNVWLRPPGPKIDGARQAAAIYGPVGLPFLSAIYTGLLTPVVLWFLRRFRKVFAFQGSYRRGFR